MNIKYADITLWQQKKSSKENMKPNHMRYVSNGVSGIIIG